MFSAQVADHTPHVGTSRVLPLPFGIGLAVGGSSTVLAAIVGFFADSQASRGDMSWLAALGLLAVLAGVVVARLQIATRITASMGLSMLVAVWSGATISAAAAFWVSGEFHTAANAIFDAVSATTTTGFTTVSDPRELTYAVRLLRVLLPWTTGLGILIAAMGVLPLTISGAELAHNTPVRSGRRLVGKPRAAVGNIVALYVALTLALFGGYAVGGMNFFDALTYSLSTASTGGMANHPDSIGAVDNLFIAWVATFGMVAAGGNLLLVWWALRGAWQPIWRSTELRLYLSLLFLGALLVWVADSDTSLTDSAFAVSSMLSTTGLRSSNWAAGAPVVQAVLLVFAGIGAMSGSVGSGVRLARVARVALEARRGLNRLLNPTGIAVVRIDGAAVRETSLDRTFGYIWMHLITLAVVAAMLNTTRLDVLGTLSFTLALVSNVGVLIDDGSITSVVRLSGWSEGVGAFAMVLGRLSIYPVLLAVAGVGRALTRLRPHPEFGTGT